MSAYLLLFAIVLGVNLLPALGPPTWSIVALYGLNSHLSLPFVVVVAAAAAALGRYALAHGFRLLRHHIPTRMKANLEAAGNALQRRKRHAVLALGLFALSPLPSAQLFEAAGLTGVRLWPFTLAFFGGRLVSYSIYGATAKRIGASSLGDSVRHQLTSPLGIGLQLLMIGLLVAVAQIDWTKRLGRTGTSENDARAFRRKSK